MPKIFYLKHIPQLSVELKTHKKIRQRNVPLYITYGTEMAAPKRNVPLILSLVLDWQTLGVNCLLLVGKSKGNIYGKHIYTK